MTDDLKHAEEGLIGCVLLDAARCYEATRTLRGADFADATLGRLFDLLMGYQAAGLPVSDLRWLCQAMQGTEPYQSLGPAEIARIASDQPNIAHTQHYADVIKDASMRRRLTLEAASMLESLRDGDMATAVDRMRRALDDTQTATTQRDTFTIDECIGQSLARIDALRSGRQHRGIVTGVRTIDAIAGSLLPGELAVLGARPAMGKSSLAFDIASNAASCGHAVLYVSCEMDASSMGDRALSRETGIDTETIQGGYGDDAILERARHRCAGLPITIWQASAPTTLEVVAKARSQQAKHGCQLVIVDHLGLMRDDGKTRYEAVSRITRGLKQAAMGLGVPILALCQLNRTGEGEEPTLAMLRDSGSIEEDCDKAWLLHRPNRASEEATFLIAKYRNGSVGRTADGYLRFDRNRCSFVDATPGDCEDFAHG